MLGSLVRPDTRTDVRTADGRAGAGQSDADGVLGGRLKVGQSEVSSSGRQSDADRRGTAAAVHYIHADREPGNVVDRISTDRPLQQADRLRQIVRLTTSPVSHATHAHYPC